MPPYRNERGFALPLTVFVLTLITIMLSAVLVEVQIDRRIAESSGDVVKALTVAQAGLDRYMVHYDSLATRPPNGDSVRFNVTAGYADVVARVIRQTDTVQNILYVVRSSGRLITPTQGSDPQAVRTVAQFARWQVGSLGVIGALTAVNDFRKPCGTPGCDGSFTLNGYDECAVAPTVTGLRVPQGATPNGLGPPQVTPATVETGTASAVATATGIAWASVVNGSFGPDYQTLTAPLTWSSYLLAGNVILGDVIGTGLLVVTGDLAIDSTSTLFDWRGVVAVGGKITFGADTTRIHGAVLSGLNQQIGSPASQGSWGPAGTRVEIRYNSCHVLQAMRSLTGFAPIANAWLDNWASY